MRLFLDTEFNGFNGSLISLALVPEDPNLSEFYKEVEIYEPLHPWVKENVIPHLILLPIAKTDLGKLLAEYLWQFDDIEIVADWPDDVRYMCETLISSPGNRYNTPGVIRFTLDFGIKYISEVPHNALYDARAIRDFYKK